MQEWLNCHLEVNFGNIISTVYIYIYMKFQHLKFSPYVANILSSQGHEYKVTVSANKKQTVMKHMKGQYLQPQPLTVTSYP
jgi:hypothetical protein